MQDQVEQLKALLKEAQAVVKVQYMQACGHLYQGGDVDSALTMRDMMKDLDQRIDNAI